MWNQQWSQYSGAPPLPTTAPPPPPQEPVSGPVPLAAASASPVIGPMLPMSNLAAQPTAALPVSPAVPVASAATSLSAPPAAGANPYSQYTAAQYAAMTPEQQYALQQHWQQWQKYQEEYAKWHAQYGEQYKREMELAQAASTTTPATPAYNPYYQQPPPAPAQPGPKITGQPQLYSQPPPPKAPAAAQSINEQSTPNYTPVVPTAVNQAQQHQQAPPQWQNQPPSFSQPPPNFSQQNASTSHSGNLNSQPFQQPPWAGGPSHAGPPPPPPNQQIANSDNRGNRGPSNWQGPNNGPNNQGYNWNSNNNNPQNNPDDNRPPNSWKNQAVPPNQNFGPTDLNSLEDNKLREGEKMPQQNDNANNSYSSSRNIEPNNRSFSGNYRGPNNWNENSDNCSVGQGPNDSKGPNDWNEGANNQGSNAPNNWKNDPNDRNFNPNNRPGSNNWNDGPKNRSGPNNWNDGPNNRSGPNNWNDAPNNRNGPSNWNDGPNNRRGPNNWNDGPNNRSEPDNNWNNGNNSRAQNAWNDGPNNRSGQTNWYDGPNNRGSNNRGVNNRTDDDRWNDRGNNRNWDNRGNSGLNNRGPDNNRGTNQRSGPNNNNNNRPRVSDLDEEMFDRQFRQWEQQFEDWKKANANHPDKEMYKRYEQEFENQRRRIAERREQMRRRKLEQMGLDPNQPPPQQQPQQQQPQQQQPQQQQPLQHQPQQQQPLQQQPQQQQPQQQQPLQQQPQQQQPQQQQPLQQQPLQQHPLQQQPLQQQQLQEQPLQQQQQPSCLPNESIEIDNFESRDSLGRKRNDSIGSQHSSTSKPNREKNQNKDPVVNIVNATDSTSTEEASNKQDLDEATNKPNDNSSDKTPLCDAKKDDENKVAINKDVKKITTGLLGKRKSRFDTPGPPPNKTKPIDSVEVITLDDDDDDSAVQEKPEENQGKMSEIFKKVDGIPGLDLTGESFSGITSAKDSEQSESDKKNISEPTVVKNQNVTTKKIPSLFDIKVDRPDMNDMDDRKTTPVTMQATASVAVPNAIPDLAKSLNDPDFLKKISEAVAQAKGGEPAKVQDSDNRQLSFSEWKQHGKNDDVKQNKDIVELDTLNPGVKVASRSEVDNEMDLNFRGGDSGADRDMQRNMGHNQNMGPNNSFGNNNLGGSNNWGPNGPNNWGPNGPNDRNNWGPNGPNDRNNWGPNGPNGPNNWGPNGPNGPNNWGPNGPNGPNNWGNNGPNGPNIWNNNGPNGPNNWGPNGRNNWGPNGNNSCGPNNWGPNNNFGGPNNRGGNNFGPNRNSFGPNGPGRNFDDGPNNGPGRNFGRDGNNFGPNDNSGRNFGRDGPNFDQNNGRGRQFGRDGSGGNRRNFGRDGSGDNRGNKDRKGSNDRRDRSRSKSNFSKDGSASDDNATPNRNINNPFRRNDVPSNLPNLEADSGPKPKDQKDSWIKGPDAHDIIDYGDYYRPVQVIDYSNTANATSTTIAPKVIDYGHKPVNNDDGNDFKPFKIINYDHAPRAKNQQQQQQQQQKRLTPAQKRKKRRNKNNPQQQKNQKNNQQKNQNQNQNQNQKQIQQQQQQQQQEKISQTNQNITKTANEEKTESKKDIQEQNRNEIVKTDEDALEEISETDDIPEEPESPPPPPPPMINSSGVFTPFTAHDTSSLSIFPSTADANENLPKVSSAHVQMSIPTEENNNTISIDEILMRPGRQTRPKKICIILRGPPGSGKSHVAKLIKEKEKEMSGNNPRILSIDDYFLIENDYEEKCPKTGKKIPKKEILYEYDKVMEEKYMEYLIKSFKKTVADNLYDFIVVDCNNNSLRTLNEFYCHSKDSGFVPYIIDLFCDLETCLSRNIHERSKSDIKAIIDTWKTTPAHYIKLDISSLLQNIVEMEDAENMVVDDNTVIEIADDNENIEEHNKEIVNEIEMADTKAQDIDEDDEDDSNDSLANCGFLKSKWETDTTTQNLARLDGTSKLTLKRKPTMEEYLQMDEWQPPTDTKGKKRVRWADIEEKRKQEKMRAVGFVVGQTDWKRMMDPNAARRALNKTKYIERVNKRR